MKNLFKNGSVLLGMLSVMLVGFGACSVSLDPSKAYNYNFVGTEWEKTTLGESVTKTVRTFNEVGDLLTNSIETKPVTEVYETISFGKLDMATKLGTITHRIETRFAGDFDGSYIDSITDDGTEIFWDFSAIEIDDGDDPSLNLPLENDLSYIGFNNEVYNIKENYYKYEKLTDFKGRIYYNIYNEKTVSILTIFKINTTDSYTFTYGRKDGVTSTVLHNSKLKIKECFPYYLEDDKGYRIIYNLKTTQLNKFYLGDVELNDFIKIK